MKNLQGRFRELTYFELLKMNGGYGGSSGGTGGGYSSSSGGSSGSRNPGNNSKQTFVSRDKYTKTTSTKNADGSETITKTNTKTGEIISSYTTGLKTGQNSKGYASSSGGSNSYSSSSSGYSTTSSGSHGYSGTSSGSSSKTNYGTPAGGSTTNTPKSNFEYQICSNPNEVHCDIIAWNHAVDAGLNPAGKRNKKWDGNKLTVDTIFNTYYADEAVEFNSDLAGKKGYIFYDWEGDGTFDHMEYCEIDNDGGGYSFYNNTGKKESEIFHHRLFLEDKNAGADNNGSGILKFVSLN